MYETEISSYWQGKSISKIKLKSSDWVHVECNRYQQHKLYLLKLKYFLVTKQSKKNQLHSNSMETVLVDRTTVHRDSLLGQKHWIDAKESFLIKLKNDIIAFVFPWPFNSLRSFG